MGISFVVVLVLVDSFMDCGFHLSPSSFIDSMYYHGALTLMQCTLRFASILSPSQVLYPPCMNVCHDLKPHEWDDHHVRRKSQRPSEVPIVGTPDIGQNSRLSELPEMVGTPDPMVNTPFMFLHFSMFVRFSLSCFLVPLCVFRSHGRWQSIAS